MAKHSVTSVIRATAVSVSITAVFYFSQSYLLSLVLDAQAGIGMLYVERIAGRLFLVAWLTALLLFAGIEFRSRGLTIVGGIAVTPVLAFAMYAIGKTIADENALAAVSNSKTTSVHLDRYLNYQTTYWGTELANRLALHPHASNKLLWALYNRGDDSTLYCIARNPKAPSDILEQLAEHSDPIIHDAARETITRSH